MLRFLAIFALAFCVLPMQTYAQPDKAQQTSKSDKPSLPAAPIVPQQADSASLQNEAKNHIDADVRVTLTPNKDGYEVAGFWVSVALAVIALGGVVVARNTLRTIQSQLDEIRAAGRQTDQMIEHAGKQADAARISADALVSSERAWVQVEVTGNADWVKASEGSSKMWFRPLLKNYGRTPATVEFMVVRPHLLPRDESFPEPPQLPPEPDYASPQSAYTDRHGFVPPLMGINPLAIAITDADFEAMKKREMFLYVYGQIFYRDIAGQGRESRFCNLYWIPPDESHPAPEGFMTSGNTPHAYTECT